MATYGGHISLDELAKMQAKRGVGLSAGGGAGGFAGPAGFAGVPYGDLASSINAGMTSEAAKPYAANLPNYANMVGKRSENIMGQLAGNVPDDVVNQIIQTGAERGILTGSAMSPNANSAMLRALGLTSLGLQQQGSQNLTAAINDTPVPQLFNPAILIVPTTLAQQGIDAAIAGRNAGGGASGGGGWGGGGVSYNLPQAGPPAPAIPRWNPGASPVAYGPGGGPGTSWSNPTPQTQDNWWERDVNNSAAWPGMASQSYWDSPEGLQNPNRPADEATALGDPFEDFWNMPLSAQQPDQSSDLEYDYWGF